MTHLHDEWNRLIIDIEMAGMSRGPLFLYNVVVDETITAVNGKRVETLYNVSLRVSPLLAYESRMYMTEDLRRFIKTVEGAADARDGIVLDGLQIDDKWEKDMRYIKFSAKLSSPIVEAQ